MSFNVEVIEDRQLEISQFLDDRIYEYNSTSTGRSDGKLFAMVIRDNSNNIVGGITGWTWAMISEITLLWVDETFRNRGFGKMLLNAAENEIDKRSCKTILIRSYAFQAPDFYIQNGYEVIFVLNDFPEGYKYYNLIKRIR
jgi:ribosomal protein S18 acetylase RimI-like enzyme